MRIEELKKTLYDIVKEYFNGVEVVWSKQKRAVKQSEGLIVLSLGRISHPTHFIKKLKNEFPIGYISSQLTLEVQLFTKGGEKRVTDRKGVVHTIVENTALEDLMDFELYMSSDYVQEKCKEKDISILTFSSPIDTSEVVDSEWEYRAMSEYSVSFVQTTQGMAGITRKDWLPTPSGGGTRELADMEDEFIDPNSVIIEEEK